MKNIIWLVVAAVIVVAGIALVRGQNPVDAVKDATENTTNVVENVVETAGDVAGDAANVVEDAADTVVETTEAVVDAVEDAAEVVEDAAEAVGDAAENAAEMATGEENESEEDGSEEGNENEPEEKEAEEMDMNDKEEEMVEVKASYTEYNPEAKPEGKHALYFWASWCPSCVKGEKKIMESLENMSEEAMIYKVDFDQYEELKELYGVKKQHTGVMISADGSVEVKPGVSVEDFEEFFKN